MKTRYGILIVPVLFVLSVIGLQAQDKVLNIYYISHSEATNEKCLLNNLQLAKPISADDAAIFYLANAEKPVVSYINLPFEGTPFNTILQEINTKSSHEVFPEVDCKELRLLFDKIEPYLDKYGIVVLNYYIDSIFWEFYSQSIIAKMYYVLDFKSRTDKMSMNIYFTEGDEPVFDKEMPFGVRNLCDGYEFVPLILYE